MKYYLREGLLHAGRSLSRTQADYDDSHVERVRLVRALTEVGGLSLATVRRVLDTIESSDVERLGVLGAAQRSLLGEEWVQVDESQEAREAATPPARAWDFLQDRGWQVHPGNPTIVDLERAWTACEQAGIGLSAERMGVYADAAEQIAAVDVGSVPADPQGAVRQVVLGTVLVDPVLAALRTLADASPAEVYELVSDVTRTGEWSVVCRAAEWEDPSRTGEGARFLGHNETPTRTWTTTSTVVAATPGEEFAWVVGDGFVRWGYRMAPSAQIEGGTELTHEWAFLPAGQEMFVGRYGADAPAEVEQRTRSAHDSIPQTLSTLRDLLEHRPGPPYGFARSWRANP